MMKPGYSKAFMQVQFAEAVKQLLQRRCVQCPQNAYKECHLT